MSNQRKRQVFVSYSRSGIGGRVLIPDLKLGLESAGDVYCTWDVREGMEGARLAPALGRVLRESDLVVAFLDPGWLRSSDDDGKSAPISWQAQELVVAAFLDIPILVVTSASRPQLLAELRLESLEQALKSVPWVDDWRTREEMVSQAVAAARNRLSESQPDEVIAEVELATEQDRFYARFSELLREATQQVEILGSGFSIETPADAKRGWDYLRVLAGCALRLPLVRHEPLLAANVEWIDSVVRYLAHLGSVQIHPYLPSSAPSLFDVGLMDPGTHHGWIEMMVPAHRSASSPGQFGVGVFIRSRAHSEQLSRIVGLQRSSSADAIGPSDNQKAINLASVYLKAVGEELAPHARQKLEQLVDELEAQNQSAGTELVFSYGSNMDPSQMVLRCPSARAVAVGRLRDWTWEFKPGVVRPGTVATIVQEPGERVVGMIYEITSLDLERLDFYEGASQPRGAGLLTEYERSDALGVTGSASLQGRPINTYVAVPDGGVQRRHHASIPSGEYRVRLLAGLRAVEEFGGLSEADEAAVKRFVRRLR